MDRRPAYNHWRRIHRLWKIKMAKTTIISLGGSIIFPDKIDIAFLKKFREIITAQIKKGSRFAIYAGGGKLARDCQTAVSEIVGYEQESMDCIGIEATYLNALLLRIIFKKYAEDKIIQNPTEKINLKKPILLCSGWKPGWSTDYDAVLLAKNLGVNTLINITNVDYVYNKNPRKYKNAKPLNEIIWKGFRKLVGNKWAPGLNMPFDPIAAKEAEKSKLRVIIIGNNLHNLGNLLNGKKFKGTVIR